MLGAYVGLPSVTQLLMVRQPVLIPLLLLIRVSVFLREEGSNTRQLGRIMIGLALILVSLDMILGTAEPMITNTGTQVFVGYLGRDLLTAFVIGAVFARAIQSSAAAVLLFVTLAAQSILSTAAAATMILGANLDGGQIVFLLTYFAPIAVRRMLTGNLILRGDGAALGSL